MLTLSRIFAIAHTEFRFGFRRGAPVAVTVLIGLIVGAGLLIPTITMLPDISPYTKMTPDTVAKLAALGLTPAQWLGFYRDMVGDMFAAFSMMAWVLIYMALLLLPMATSGSIPADRKFGVSEILHSMPISGFAYLSGKILGMVVTVLTVGAFMLCLFFVVTDIVLFSRFQYGLYLYASWFLIKLALLDGLPMLVWGATAGVLAGIFFRTRRAAIFPALLAGAASLVGWVYVFRAPAQGSFGMKTDLVDYYLVQNYNSPAITFMTKLSEESLDMFGLAGAPRVGIGQLVLMYLALIAALVVLSCLARLWLQWKENF